MTENHTFQSALLNWENLNYPDLSTEELVGRVLAGKKPLAFVDGSDQVLINLLEQRAKTAGAKTLLEFHAFEGLKNQVPYYFLSVAREGIIGETFNLKEVIEEYDSHLKSKKERELLPQIKQELNRLAPLKFADFLEFVKAETDPRGPADYARTGQLLGFPIGSTRK